MQRIRKCLYSLDVDSIICREYTEVATDLPYKTRFLLMDVKYGSPPHLNCFLVHKFCYGPVDGSHPFHVRPPQNPQKLGVSDTMEASLDGFLQENAASFVA